MYSPPSSSYFSTKPSSRTGALTSGSAGGDNNTLSAIAELRAVLQGVGLAEGLLGETVGVAVSSVLEWIVHHTFWLARAVPPWWHTLLRWSSPAFSLLEGISTLLVIQVRLQQVLSARPDHPGPDVSGQNRFLAVCRASSSQLHSHHLLLRGVNGFLGYLRLAWEEPKAGSCSSLSAQPSFTFRALLRCGCRSTGRLEIDLVRQRRQAPLYHPRCGLLRSLLRSVKATS